MDEIKQKVKDRHNKYNYILYKQNEEEFINRTAEYNYLIEITNRPFIDIIKEVRIKHNYKYGFNKPEIDLMQHCSKINALMVGLPIEDIKKRYSLPYEEVEERIMYRIELYKEGWDVEQIEKYIYRYILNQEYDLTEEDIKILECLYHNIMTRIEIYKKTKKNKIGRPSLPLLLKEYIRKKHIDKTREEMRKKYDYSSKYEIIKDNLLTSEEIEKLSLLLDENDIILKKLKFLAIV